MSVIRKSLVAAVERALKGDADKLSEVTAGSRLERLGTIYSRVTGLIKSEVYAKSDIPLWYHVYQAFPPKYEPVRARQPFTDIKVQHIFYPEDKLRAQITRKELVNLCSKEKTENEKKVEEYIKLRKSSPNENDEEIINRILKRNLDSKAVES